MTTADQVEVEDYASQAREFLRRSRAYLAAGDLHQASEKGWGAAAHMAKAVAAANGWEYDKHRDFSHVLINAWELTGNDAILPLRAIANELHSNYYRRSRYLNARAIVADIEHVADLLDLLEPLTV